MNRRDALSLLTLGSSAAFIPWQDAQAEGSLLRGYLRTNWSRDPFSFGSYSYVAKGAHQRDRQTLGAPIDNRVFFAGEAFHPKQNSTVHAAYESGVMAAQEVARHTKGRVAVIGAGVAGLAAAQTLAKGGRAVTVFEARPEIGGRLRTNHDLGVPLDLGASWIHGTRRNPISKLAKAAGAQTVATDETYIVRGTQGRRISDADTPRWLETVASIQQNAGADPSELNLQAYENEPQFGGAEVIFPKGYESILPALRGDYEVKTSQQISAVAYDETGVVLTSKRQEHSAEVVIVTLPLGVLKRDAVAFTPPLPAAKRRAIKDLGMGTLDKLYLLYDKPFWDQDITWILTPENGLERGQFNQWLNLYKYLDVPVIMAFNGATPARTLAKFSDRPLVDLGRRALESAYA